MSRPLGPYFDALSKNGVSASVENGALTVTGQLTPGVFALPGDISSQFVSGLLLALPLLDGDSDILLTTPLQSASYVGLTIDMMARFGVTARRAGSGFTVKGGQSYRPVNVSAEADYSPAAFFLVAGALGCPCECRGLSGDSAQGDRAVLDILKNAGARLERAPDGGITARPGNLKAQTVDVSDIPDLVPPLAALFAFCPGVSKITNAARLRHKESDRLEAVTSALNALGARTAIAGDSIIINGVDSLRGGVADSRGDHRIAMMSAVAAIRSLGPVTVTQSECVSKAYPEFCVDFEKVKRVV
jgi:3-phosphoshikimate 1-carboxyvinyltransferase